MHSSTKGRIGKRNDPVDIILRCVCIWLLHEWNELQATDAPPIIGLRDRALGSNRVLLASTVPKMYLFFAACLIKSDITVHIPSLMVLENRDRAHVLPCGALPHKVRP